MNKLNVLSCFDGMSCGQIALDRLGIPVNKYFASEVDKYAIQTTQKNFPNTVQLGSITDIPSKPTINGHKIDLLIGGSPCQGFSFAGKQLNFDDPRSKLFFDFVRLKDSLKPKYFLLENVKMKKESEDIITEILGVEPIEINSRLVSAQNRKRLFWTNIPFSGKQPEDKQVLLKDILEDDSVTDRDKSHCLDANYFKGGNLKSYFEKNRRQIVFDSCLQIGTADLKGHDFIKRVYSRNAKSPTLTAKSGGNTEPKTNIGRTHWRKLTPLECERLQTVPEGYTEGVSNTQRYRMLGNGWTVDVICHIMEGLKL